MITRPDGTVPRVLNRHIDEIPPDAVNVERPSKWGNPFIIGRDGNRDQVCDKYDKMIRNLTPFQAHEFMNAVLRDLKGRDLFCVCVPLRCHGTTLLRLANSL
jgi:hypothetical protein